MFADNSFQFCNLGREILPPPLTEKETEGDRFFTEYNPRASLSPIGRPGEKCRFLGHTLTYRICLLSDGRFLGSEFFRRNFKRAGLGYSTG